MSRPMAIPAPAVIGPDKKATTAAGSPYMVAATSPVAAVMASNKLIGTESQQGRESLPLGSTAFTGSSPAYTYRLAELRSPKLLPTGFCRIQRPIALVPALLAALIGVRTNEVWCIVSC